MDPVSQGVLGALAAQSAARKKNLGAASVVGALGGMAPDLDVLIQSSTDPLLFLEYHRQFTHSLFFIPFGGLIVGVILYYLGMKKRLTLPQTIAFSTLGYATHALLDAFTSYGTQLLWPFSNARFSWDSMSIIDPLFTIPLLILVIVYAIFRSTRLRWIAPVYCCAFLLFGSYQHQQASNQALDLAQSRGHTVQPSVKPSFGNLLLWKSIYEWNGRYYVDAVRLGSPRSVLEGTSVKKLDWSALQGCIASNSKQYNDVKRFDWFSQGYLAISTDNPNYIVDIRYSMLPNEVAPLWGIIINCDTPDKHVEYVMNRDTSADQWQIFWDMLLNNQAGS